MVNSPMITNPTAYQFMQQALEKFGNDADAFISHIQEQKYPHLSFSKIYTVETCERRYVLQYIRGIHPDPMPESLLKGKAFHKMAAAYYRSNGRFVGSAELCDVGLSEYTGTHYQHLKNAAEVLLQQKWYGHEILGVERAFVMLLGVDLPPLVGVIDLILKQNSSLVIVDHKTGRDFYQPEPLQMAIYKRYIESEISECKETAFYYDHYRWVQSNMRARKPLFQRLRVSDSDLAWQPAFERIQEGYQRILELERGSHPRTGSICYMCPLRSYCCHN